MRSPAYYGPSNLQVRAKRSGNMGLAAQQSQSRREYRSPSPSSFSSSRDAPLLQPDYDDDNFIPSAGYISQNIPQSQRGINSSGVTTAITRGGLISHNAHGHNIHVNSISKSSRNNAQDASAASLHWREAYSSAGKRYYYNIVTQESTYRRPANYIPAS